MRQIIPTTLVSSGQSIQFDEMMLKVSNLDAGKTAGEQNKLSFELLHGETGRERLLQLPGLFTILDNQSVEEATASNLEFNIAFVLLDLHRTGVLPPRRQQKVFNFLYLLGHDWELVYTVV